jgi:hypothetical protein
MITRKMLGRVAVAAAAAILVAGTVAFVERGAGPAGSGLQLTPPISRPVDASQLTGPRADSTLDSATPVSRSTESASDGTFCVTLSVSATTHHAVDALDIFATLTYQGPQPSIAISGDSMGLVFFTFTQLDGTRSMVPVSDLMCAPTTLERQATATFRPVKSIGWTAEDPNAAFYKQWASDPQVHLPAGRWQILATAQIYVATSCYGGTPDHKLVMPPLIVDVAP